MDLAELQGYAGHPLMRFDRDHCCALYGAWRAFWDHILSDVSEDQKKSAMVCFDFFGGRIGTCVRIPYDGRMWNDHDTKLAEKLFEKSKKDISRTVEQCGCDASKHERSLEKALEIIHRAKEWYEKRRGRLN